MSLLFVFAIAAAIIAVAHKKLRAGPRFKEDASPRIVGSHREIDEAVPTRCGCGGRFHREGEGPKTVEGVECVRVLLVCARCERERALLFRLAN